MRIRISQLYALVLVLLIMLSGNYWEQTAPLVNAFLFLIGMVLAGIGSMGRLWCTLYIAGYKENTLITAGPYSMTRNPLYFFSLIGALGVGFATETFIIPLLILIGFALYYPSVIKSEELRLRELHKGAFDEYVSKVPRFFPRVENFSEPEDYVIKPVLFRKNIFDALWFIWLIGILEVIETLHDVHILPSLIDLF
ncbi:MAG: isoprenylcysteine carboxylmethyltransferase family protein [Syntrophaceae bacterium]